MQCSRQLLTALLSLVAGPALAAQATAPAAPPANPCAASEFHQFDFWAGQWDVYGVKGKQVANSLIEKVYGCGIRENWMPFGATGAGGSLNTYVPGDKHWEQFWIDSGGTRATFVGGLKGKDMVIEGEWARAAGADHLHPQRRRLGAPIWRAVDRRRQDLGAELRPHVPAAPGRHAVSDAPGLGHKKARSKGGRLH